MQDNTRAVAAGREKGGLSNWARGLAVFLLMALMGAVSATAQILDSSLFEELDRIRNQQGPVQTPSPVDTSRQQGMMGQPVTPYPPYMYELPPRPLSRLEKDYQKRSNSDVRQYGYDLFSQTMQTFDATVGRMADSYVMGVGDKVVVIFHGSTQKSITTTVDREGRIIVEGLPPVAAAGRTFAEVEKEIRQGVADAFIGTEAFVSLGALRQLAVYVVGEVERPGLYRLTSLSTVLDALSAAGGVKSTGSLRNIRVVTDQGSRVLDLYGLMMGQGGDARLSDGAKVVVPVIGATAAVVGEVLRPGIYELPKGPITQRDLVSLAGGTIRPSGYGFVLNRVDASGRQKVDTLSALTGTVADGDIINVGLRFDAAMGAVELVGHVRSPGLRSLSEAPTLKALLRSVDVYKEYPYVLFGAIETSDPTTQVRYLEAFSPEQVLFGDKDRPLRDKDRVILFGRSDIDFLSSSHTRRVILSGVYTPVVEPGDRVIKRCQPLEELARLVGDTRTVRFATAVRAVFSQLDVTDIGSASRIETERQEQEANLNRQIAEMAKQEEEAALQAQQKAAAAMPVKATPYYGMGYYGMGQRMDEAKAADEEEEKDTPSCPKVYQQAGNLLPFTLEYVAGADGAVRLPGVYPLAVPTSISSLIAAAGGPTVGADLSSIEVESATTLEAKGGRTVLKGGADLASVLVTPGGGIRLNTVFREEQGGAVMLSGEFKNPGVYAIQRGETLSQLIARAGGLTDEAYPYGTVFTRVRVRNEERAGLKRSAKELDAGLATAALKQRELSADTIVAARQLSEALANSEVIGRVVVEADPRVLAERPDLDTVLEPGDEIFVPKRPNYVLTIGDVLNPGGMQFTPGKSVKEYIKEAGGIQSTADKKRIFVVYPNGQAKPAKLSSWGYSSGVMVPPGTVIVVPKDVEPIDTLNLVRDLSAIFSQLAVSAASIAVISR
jgi:polysaccharide export outer membrane protein